MIIRKLSKPFIKWYKTDINRINSKFNKTIKHSFMGTLSDKELITFFKDFCNYSGGIQSGGERNKNNFEK